MIYDIELSLFNVIGRCKICNKVKDEKMYKCKRWMMLDEESKNIGISRKELVLICIKCCKNKNEVEEYLNNGGVKNG